MSQIIRQRNYETITNAAKLFKSHHGQNYLLCENIECTVSYFIVNKTDTIHLDRIVNVPSKIMCLILKIIMLDVYN